MHTIRIMMCLLLMSAEYRWMDTSEISDDVARLIVITFYPSKTNSRYGPAYHWLCFCGISVDSKLLFQYSIDSFIVVGSEAQNPMLIDFLYIYVT